ncbi:MAG: endopeptidase La [Bradymonadales bacterium]
MPANIEENTQIKKLLLIAVENVVLFPQQVLSVNEISAGMLKAIEEAVKRNELIYFAPVREGAEVEDVEDLGPIVVRANVVKVLKSPRNSYSVVLHGSKRMRPVEMEYEGNFVFLSAVPVHEEGLLADGPEAVEDFALWESVKKAARRLLDTVSDIDKDLGKLFGAIKEQGQFCDLVGGAVDFSFEEKLGILYALSVRERLQQVLRLLLKRVEIHTISHKIHSQVKEEIDKTQKEFFLRHQLKAIKDQLGEDNFEVLELDELREKVESLDLPDDVRERCHKQLSRLRLMQAASPEYSVTRNYLETLLEIPWRIRSEDDLSITRARRILDEDHYDLETVKKRIIEFLAVLSLKKDLKGPILCLHGPPGVGKTSLGKSVARALGRKFYRFSLGGMHDESEIRGHRRTYVGALPGRIVQALRKVKTINPVIMLDEIDKVGKDFRGDPSSALLEVLDPEQNFAFSDHYVELPVDLSQVLFIATANQLDTIAPPLRDRMEIIEIPGYTHHDKVEIARQFLIPKLLENHGITESHIEIDNDSLNMVINNHTREAGVRGLEQRLAELCRNAAVGVANARDKGEDEPKLSVNVEKLNEILGPIRFEYEVAQRTAVSGVSTGLAWTASGGDILFIEVSSMPGKGDLVITGKLGDVMQESVRAALSYIRSHYEEFDLEENFNKNIDIHLHIPAGAIPKDGPSAGITIFGALLSLFQNRRVRPDIAMTGEITLRGHVLPVGGIKEKVLAAHRAGIRKIIMPARNERDLVEVKDEIRNDMEFNFVSSVAEILPLIFV